ncbi:MAG: recombinase [Legionellales bacterium]|nr:recombinase [Legionellales bacterium]|tara:strand:- start:7580 stop:7804 length:225 start_codon:yes stop_codon:yes gene_type:complete
MNNRVLDTSRLLCPMPVIKTQQMVNSLAAGDTLEVTFTDPGAAHDIPAWCRVNGHRVLELEQHDRGGRILLQVG